MSNTRIFRRDTILKEPNLRLRLLGSISVSQQNGKHQDSKDLDLRPSAAIAGAPHSPTPSTDFIGRVTRELNVTAEIWLQAEDLLSDVYLHLACYVPKVYCLGPNPNPQSEDILTQHLLLGPMEWYLCGEDPATGFAKLEQASKPSHLCGRVFKVGEPTYSCRDCASDPTCVLCMECFLGSIHKDHRYRMTTSSGGGFCDCGDTEAWKKGPYCQKHMLNKSNISEEDPLVPLSEDMVARCYNVFSILLKYAVDMLTWEKDDELPTGLQPLEKHDTYYCMLFNDEVHTYEQVIYTLQKAVNCSQKEAVSFATTVDRDGRKSVRYGEFQFCEQAKNVIVVWLQLRPEGENSSLVDKLMLCDSKLWKGARNVYHQLFMSSLLMDLKYKKLFAVQFAKNYRKLQTDFMEDDHERVVSVTALSVQLFTVPTLARMLITEEDLLTTIIRTFMDHLRHRDPQGRFQFERYTAQQAFKFRRVQSLIGDLKYVLITRPNEWTDKLREKFLEGFDAFLELLKCMQGMDPVTRQVGQHIEMEPEWEAAFTLQMKLTHIISMMQEWCASDVLIDAYKKCLALLIHCHSGFTDGEQPLTLNMFGHSVDTIRYCVSQEKVSVHLPVSRLLAGLHVLLSKTTVAYRFPEQLPLSELSPPMLIEHPLRCLVLCAQVHAGMWRRNGFSLVNQIYYYHNVKCRAEMFDKDLSVLQDVLNQNNTLIEEMLHLIIMLVGERFVPGVGHVGDSDEIRREIIHQLCIRPMAHSELVKALPEDENKETGMEAVIEAVAYFKKPGLTGRGLYELKPECSQQFNLYFYHYSRADQSKLIGIANLQAEEAQRKRKRQNGEDPAVNDYFLFPALPPPELPPFCPLYASLVNLLQCDVFLGILSSILQWALEPNSCSWTESMLQRALHLIGMALLEERQQLQTGGEDIPVTFNFTNKISCPGDAPGNAPSMLAMLETLQNVPHLEVHKDMIRWILKTFAYIKKMREQTTFSPVSDPRSLDLDELVHDKDKAERKRKAEIARLRREKIMAQMSEMQRHFIDENKELFQQTMDELEPSTSSSLDHSPSIPDAVLVGLGPWKTWAPDKRQVVTCILCQEEQEIKMDGKAMVLAAFVQRSTVMSKNRKRTVTDQEDSDPLFMLQDLPCGTHTGSCGHVMHSQCWQRYFDAVQAKEQRRQQRLRVHTSYDVENGEFLCPLCECLSNTVIPLLPLGQTLSERNPFSASITEMLTTFGTATHKVGLKVHPNEKDPRLPLVCWGSCAYKRLLSDEDKPLFCSLPCRQDDCLKYLTRFGAASWRVSSLSVVQNHFIRLLAALMPNAHVEKSPGILDIDMFHLLVSLILSYSSVHCQDFSGHSLATGELHLFHLVTMAHIVQIVLTSAPGLGAMEQDVGGGGEGVDEEVASESLFCLLRQYTGRWCSHPETQSHLLCHNVSLSYPRESNHLVPLPEDYSSLINQASSFTCPKSGGDKSRAPTLCLVCGTMLCSQSYCCQTELDGEDVGACTAHTFTCGAGVGIFLRVRECQVLFLAGKTKGCFYPPPYLDDYGETDQGLRRGNPLHLCQERYRKIERLWQQHSITEEIGHAQEANQTLVGIDWQHL
ncbi:UBR2 ligase, partial [Polypterus senegalus]